VVANHGGTVRTAPGPVAAGPVLGHSERRAIGLGSCQDVMPVGGVAAAADNIAFLGQRGFLNRVQFETRRFRVRSSLSERLWKVGTTGF
jgi:hypothetical protein